jgi:hypothetical protein
MKDLGMMHYFLGPEVWQRQDEVFLNQGKYTVEILKRFGMFDCKEMATPMVSNLHYGLRYVTDHEFGLYGYLDSDWADNIPDRKSTLAYCFSLGSSMVS